MFSTFTVVGDLSPKLTARFAPLGAVGVVCDGPEIPLWVGPGCGSTPGSTWNPATSGRPFSNPAQGRRGEGLGAGARGRGRSAQSVPKGQTGEKEATELSHLQKAHPPLLLLGTLLGPLLGRVTEAAVPEKRPGAGRALTRRPSVRRPVCRGSRATCLGLCAGAAREHRYVPSCSHPGSPPLRSPGLHSPRHRKAQAAWRPRNGKPGSDVVQAIIGRSASLPTPTPVAWACTGRVSTYGKNTVALCGPETPLTEPPGVPFELKTSETVYRCFLLVFSCSTTTRELCEPSVLDVLKKYGVLFYDHS
ncbi:uncharacterized protein LOC124979516 [Sciurus carolinensis]|uniref:uncharacterized protein LOC124979516 n=1 Tax=Sciurus carolinensis TaxID=30640 RepID=UPI001FB28A20|nr:uncharacterized protein LOC124979516 [Sciurus carolinensis]